MSQRRAIRYAVLLAAVALVLLLLSALFQRIWPQLATPHIGPPKRETVDKIEQFPIQETPLTKVKNNDYQIPTWPDQSTLPAYHASDLSVYYNKKQGPEALQGITIFLDPALGGDVQGYEKKIGAADELNDNVLFSEAEMNLKVAENIQVHLERLGANVILLRNGNFTMTDEERAARVAHYLLQQFQAELTEREFQSERLRELEETLFLAIRDKDQATLETIFTPDGVSQDLRLLLDLEEQYAEMLYLRIKHDAEPNNPQTKGFRIRLISLIQMAETGTAEAPAYMRYQLDANEDLALDIEHEIGTLLPELKLEQSQMQMGEAPDILRWVNLKAVEFSPGFLSNGRDMNVVLSTEQRDLAAQAVSRAIFETFTREHETESK